MSHDNALGKKFLFNHEMTRECLFLSWDVYLCPWSWVCDICRLNFSESVSQALPTHWYLLKALELQILWLYWEWANPWCRGWKVPVDGWHSPYLCSKTAPSPCLRESLDLTLLLKESFCWTDSETHWGLSPSLPIRQSFICLTRFTSRRSNR